ncbi:(E3-independent) E2 ubiquitin-conjugating enzyme [Euphorbia peplus]|nr:(E3-independent) E2 ubiquitin-conjugating enzyme [Euphorbia peplus]
MGQFAMLTDWSDHYYASNRSDEDMIDIANKTLYKRISEELCTLRTDLPSTIFVGCYYDRVDLLRAAIIGADNNIYFFDLAFRDDFPNKPLQVHYRSNGLLINPNLYNDGQVCLSPLNASEHFQSPEDSLVFLILLQIQELVRPFDKLVLPWREYNKDAFLLAFKTMMFNLNMPPKNFEDFVESFYHERRDS